MVVEEAQIVQQRIEMQAATQAGLYQMALSTIPNQAVKFEASKSALEVFGKTIKKMMGG